MQLEGTATKEEPSEPAANGEPESAGDDASKEQDASKGLLSKVADMLNLGQKPDEVAAAGVLLDALCTFAAAQEAARKLDRVCETYHAC